MRHDHDLDRRTFLKASGLTAAGLAAAPATGAAASNSETAFDPAFANWRVREASKVWERGYRGRRDRPLALTDSGVDALHPDLGPWNGVRVEDTSESFRLVANTFDPIEGADVTATETLGPGLAGSSRAEVTDVPVPANADRVRVGVIDAGLEENVQVLVENADGEVLDSNDGLLADYVGVATPVSRDQTTTVTAAVEAPDSTGADVDFYVRFFENTADQTVTTSLAEHGRQTEEGTIGPSVTGPAAQNERITLEQPPGTVEVEATLTFSPQPQDLDFALEDEDGNEVASSGNFPGSNESFSTAIDDTTNYELVIRGFAVAQADYEVTAVFFEETTQVTDGPNCARRVVEDVDGVTDPGDKTVGWYGTKRYGEFATPRDGNGHGTHCSSIMAGSGRASTVERVETDEPHAVLLPTDTIEYTVDAMCNTGVFASAYGTALDVRIEDPNGETIAHSQLFGGGPSGYDASIQDSNIASAPTTHAPDDPVADADGRAPYTVHVTASQENETGAPLVARLEEITVGSYRDPGATDGEYHHAHDNDDRSIPTTVVFTAHEGDGTTALDVNYFAEAPEGPENSGPATYGPIEVSTDGETWVALAGTTDQNVVVGPSTDV